MYSQKLFTLLAFLVLGGIQPIHALNWSILELDCKDHDCLNATLEDLESPERLLSLAYQRQFIFIGSEQPETINHPHVIGQYDYATSKTNDKIPKPLRQFWNHLLEEKSEGNGPDHQHNLHLTTCHQPELTLRSPQVENPINRYNSERLAGIINCNVLFVESDGSEDPDYYTWTREAILAEQATILQALHVWAYTAFLEGIDVTFIPKWFDRPEPVGQGLEPNIRFGQWQTYAGTLTNMSNQVIRQLGFDWQPHFAADEFNFYQQRATKSDFSFTIGTHFDHNGKGSIRANANIGGPLTFLASGTGYEVYGHEIGHIFHAFDEYLSEECEQNFYVSFNGVRNENNKPGTCGGKHPCLMDNNLVLGKGDQRYYTLCPFTKAHIGWDEETLSVVPEISNLLTHTIFQNGFPTFKLKVDAPLEQVRTLYLRLWKREAERLNLILETSFEQVQEMDWQPQKGLPSGAYEIQLYHGKNSLYARIPSKSYSFEIVNDRTISFADTCVTFCRQMDTLDFGIEDLVWSETSLFEEVFHTGSRYLPEDESVFFIGKKNGNQLIDIASVRVALGDSLSPVVFPDNIINSPTNNLGVQGIFDPQQAFIYDWFRNDTLIAADAGRSLEVDRKGIYKVNVYNGCINASKPWDFELPPNLRFLPDCEKNQYELVIDRPLVITNLSTAVDTITDHLTFDLDSAGVNIRLSEPEYRYLSYGIFELDPLASVEFPMENQNGLLKVKKRDDEIVQWWRSDTLLYEGHQNWWSPDQSGTYYAKILSDQHPCGMITAKQEMDIDVPPPSISFDTIRWCLADRENIPMARAEGTQITWYLGGAGEEMIGTGNTLELDPSFFQYPTRLVATQTVGGKEGIPAISVMMGLTPIETSLDTLGNTLFAIINGEDPILSPDQYVYDWYLEKEWLATTPAPFYEATLPGNYHVEIANQSLACALVQPLYVAPLVTSRKNGPVASNDLAVFPQPASNNLTIQSSELIDRLFIYTLDGVLFQQMVEVNGNGLDVNVSGWPAGVYIGQVGFENGSFGGVKLVVGR